jgi:hypothetical protein
MKTLAARCTAAVATFGLALTPAIALAQKASTPSPVDPNSFPLEPYLVTWLLPVAGILAVALGAFVDNSTRSRYRRGNGPQSIL